MSETNVQWKRLRARTSLFSRLKEFWRSFKYITSINSHEDLGVSQRGGTCTYCVGDTSHKFHHKGTDSTGLGRWSFMYFRCYMGYTTRIITAYRTTASRPAKTSRNKTVYEHGSLTQTLSTLGLRNVFMDNSRHPLPPTHHSGSQPISAIYATNEIKSLRMGVLPIGEGISGDHRNMFVDFEYHSVMGAPKYLSESPHMRRLNLQDPRQLIHL